VKGYRFFSLPKKREVGQREKSSRPRTSSPEEGLGDRNKTTKTIEKGPPEKIGGEGEGKKRDVNVTKKKKRSPGGSQ